MITTKTTAKCQLEHTSYQPTKAEWRCPSCRKPPPEGWCIDDGLAISNDCDLIHPDDYLLCSNCGHDDNGAAWTDSLRRKKHLVPCKACKGTGLVKAPGKVPAKGKR